MSLGEALLIAASMPRQQHCNDPRRGSIEMVDLSLGLAFRYRSARPEDRLKKALRASTPQHWLLTQPLIGWLSAPQDSL